MPYKYLSGFLTIILLFISGTFGLAQSQNPTDSDDGSISNQELNPAVGTELPADAKQLLVDQLVRELDQLIPGDYAEDSKQSEQLVKIANLFAEGNEPGLRETLSELSAADPNVPPQDLLLAGMAFESNNSLQGKLLLERAGALDRQHPGIPLAFGQLAISQGRLFDAQTLVEKAQSLLQTSELSTEAKRYYEIAALNSLTIVEIRRNELKRAREYAKQWEQLAPDDDQMFLTTAEIEFLLEDIDAAQSHLQRRSEKQLAEIPTEIVLAKWFRNRNDLENYAKWVEAAWSKDPANPLTQLEYAAWQLRLDAFDTAAAAIESYEAKIGESQESQGLKGRIAFSQEDYPAAESLFALLYQQQPNNFEFSYLYVLALLESNDPQKLQQAVTLAQRNYQALPNNQLAAASMGWALLKVGKLDLGQQLLTQASKAGEMLPDTAYFLASMMIDQNRNLQAKVLLDPFLNSKQIFLYRSAAKRLLEEIDNGEDLPDPGQR